MPLKKKRQRFIIGVSMPFELKGMIYMNNTIQKIIELDRAARERVEQAQEQAQRITDECISEQERLTKESDEEIREQIERIKRDCRRKADNEIERLRATSREKCGRLDSIAQANASRWEKEIFERIFGE